MRILVCGSHRRGDRDVVFERLDYLRAWLSARRKIITLIVHGGAQYIDKFAGEWASSRGIDAVEYRADWRKLGRRAGAVRNRKMFKAERPEGVVAFPGDDGTFDMVTVADEAGCPVWFPFGRASVQRRRVRL